jgi:hypothetical protein
VIGSPLPMLVWVGWCLDQNQTSRDTGIEGYLLHVRPLGPGGIGCLVTPPFQFTADSDVVIAAANGVEYRVHYKVGALDGESLSEPREDGEMHTILEWQYNTRFSMTATPVRYGVTGVRSYEILEDDGTARSWVTEGRPLTGGATPYGSTEVPLCDWVRGIRCAPQKPNPNDGSFGPGLEALLHSRYIKTH